MPIWRLQHIGCRKKGEKEKREYASGKSLSISPLGVVVNSQIIIKVYDIMWRCYQRLHCKAILLGEGRAAPITRCQSQGHYAWGKVAVVGWGRVSSAYLWQPPHLPPISQHSTSAQSTYTLSLFQDGSLFCSTWSAKSTIHRNSITVLLSWWWCFASNAKPFLLITSFSLFRAAYVLF